MLITNFEQHNFSLENFEGPLDFLLYLIQKSEIDIYGVSISKITEQYAAYLQTRSKLCVESGAEFVNLTASLLWIKSKMLLPQYDQKGDEQNEEELDPQFGIIHHLLDYCRFKEVAKDLMQKEHKQLSYYSRGIDSSCEPVKKSLGIDHLTLSDLISVFQQVLQRGSVLKGIIEGEEWHVSDKMRSIRKFLLEEGRISIDTLFLPGQLRGEIIVIFLAILELMKLGEIRVVREESNDLVLLQG